MTCPLEHTPGMKKSKGGGKTTQMDDRKLKQLKEKQKVLTYLQGYSELSRAPFPTQTLGHFPNMRHKKVNEKSSCVILDHHENKARKKTCEDFYLLKVLVLKSMK